MFKVSYFSRAIGENTPLYISMSDFGYLRKVENKKICVNIDIDLATYSPKEAKNISQHFGANPTLNDEVQAALDKLPEMYKTPVILSYMDGYSYKEIANMLHLPVGTVMSRIARGKMFLKQEIIAATNNT